MKKISCCSIYQNYSLVDKRIIKYLKNEANKNVKGKSLLLLHKNKKQKLHEMLICQKRGFPIKPHVNYFSYKSYNVLKGEMKVFFFNSKGNFFMK